MSAPYKWAPIVAPTLDRGLFISVDSLMDLRNKMGQFQEETSAPDECLYLLDYVIRCAQITAAYGKRKL